MTDFLNDWGLTVMVFLPLVGTAIMMVIPDREEETHKTIALLFSVAAAVVGLLLLRNFDYDDTGTLQFVVDRNWIDVINVNDDDYHILWRRIEREGVLLYGTLP